MMLLLMSGCCSWTADAEWLLTLPFPYCAVLLPPEITEICRLYTRYGISLVVPQVNVTREYPTPLSQFEWPWVWGSLAPGCLYIYEGCGVRITDREGDNKAARTTIIYLRRKTFYIVDSK